MRLLISQRFRKNLEELKNSKLNDTKQVIIENSIAIPADITKHNVLHHLGKALQKHKGSKADLVLIDFPWNIQS